MENKILPFVWSKRPFLYFLFNWGSPVYVTENLLGCVEYARRMTEKWGNPLPEGAVSCRGYRPGGEPGKDFDDIDVTEIVLKCIEKW